MMNSMAVVVVPRPCRSMTSCRRIPAEHGAAFEQHDAAVFRFAADLEEGKAALQDAIEGVGAFRSSDGDRVIGGGFDGFEDSQEEVALRLELVVEGAGRDAGGSGELLGGDAGKAPLGEELAAGLDERYVCAGRALRLRSPFGHEMSVTEVGGQRQARLAGCPEATGAAVVPDARPSTCARARRARLAVSSR